MSLSYQPLEPVLVKDPRTILKNKRMYSVLRGGAEVNTKIYTSTSISSSSIQFSVPPPSGNVIIDRMVYLTLPIRLTFTGDATNTSPELLLPNRDAPRAFPISGSMETLRLSINGLAVSINMSDVIHALLRYNTGRKDKQIYYSGTPNCPDQSQQYSDLFGSIRNPLASYGDSPDESVMPRGGYSFNIVSNTSTQAIVDLVITEPIFLSPLLWGGYDEQSGGFINVNEMDFNITFLNGAGNRIWSHDDSQNTVAPFFNRITATDVQFNGFAPAFSYPRNQPQMQLTYITQDASDMYPVNQPSTYSYFDVLRYPTDIPAIPYGTGYTGVQVTSNNIQLSSIPRRLYIYARPRNSVINTSPSLTDTYCGISRLDIQFDNRTGLLSGASQYQLYAMSAKNGCNMSWTQWSGYPVNRTGVFGSGLANEKYGTVGSVMCVEFGTDIGLREYEAPGMNGQFQLLVNATFYNADTSGNKDNVPLTFYIVVVNEGSLTIPGYGHALDQIGVLSKEDVLSAKRNPFVDYCDLRKINGGNFLSGLRRFGENVADAIKKTAPYAKKGLKIAKDIAPYVKDAIEIGELLAAGEKRKPMKKKSKKGGVVVGGASMSKRMLAERMRNL